MLDKALEALKLPFESSWPFMKRFHNQGSLRMRQEDALKGISYDGVWSKNTMERIAKKILRKETVNIFIIGESVSIGADLGCQNRRRTYHYGLSRWWLKTIANYTGCKIHRHVIAVGGVATNYFDRCWKEYLVGNETIDLVLWEFALNDADAVSYRTSIERFTRSIAKYHSSPGMIFVTFFRKTFFDEYLNRNSGHPCQRHEMHELILESLARYYSVTLIDLEKTVCSVLSSNSSRLSVRDLFVSIHPSSLAHAQMTYLIIHYMRTTLYNIINNWRKDEIFTTINNIISSKDPQVILPDPIYLNSSEIHSAFEPICWTAILPNYHIKPKHYLFDLPITKFKGFKRILHTNWRDADETRYDSTGGYVAYDKGQKLDIRFNCPGGNDTERTISVAIRNKYFGGDVFVYLDRYKKYGNSTKPYAIDSSVKEHTGVNVYNLPMKVSSGRNHTLTIKTVKGGVMFCAVIIS